MRGNTGFDDRDILFATRNGTVKKVTLSLLRNSARASGIIACQLVEGDVLLGAVLLKGGVYLFESAEIEGGGRAFHTRMMVDLDLLVSQFVVVVGTMRPRTTSNTRTLPATSGSARQLRLDT